MLAHAYLSKFTHVGIGIYHLLIYYAHAYICLLIYITSYKYMHITLAYIPCSCLYMLIYLFYLHKHAHLPFVYIQRSCLHIIIDLYLFSTVSRRISHLLIPLAYAYIFLLFNEFIISFAKSLAYNNHKLFDSGIGPANLIMSL